MNQSKNNKILLKTEEKYHPNVLNKIEMICQQIKTLAESPDAEELKQKNKNSESQQTVISSYHREKPFNLLFSVDQFLFEFQKKQPQTKKVSDFKQQLQEQKKLSLFYGNLSKKQLLRVVHKSRSQRGNFAKNFLSLLEKRLDVVLMRSGFVYNIQQAQQLISHKKITVNHKIITISSYTVTAGDIISIVPNYHIPFIKTRINQIKTNFKKQNKVDIISPNYLSKIEPIVVEDNVWQNTVQKFTQFLFKKIEARYNISYQSSMGKKIQTGSLKQSINLNNINLRKPTELTKNPQIFKNKFSEISKTYRTQFLKILSQISFINFSRNIFLLLLKKHMTKQETDKEFLIGLRSHGLKPIHLEISYQILTIIFLYPPQRVYFPFLVDIDILKKM